MLHIAYIQFSDKEEDFQDFPERRTLKGKEFNFSPLLRIKQIKDKKNTFEVFHTEQQIHPSFYAKNISILTIVVGKNGDGKTALLRALSSHWYLYDASIQWVMAFIPPGKSHQNMSGPRLLVFRNKRSEGNDDPIEITTAQNPDSLSIKSEIIKNGLDAAVEFKSCYYSPSTRVWEWPFAGNYFGDHQIKLTKHSKIDLSDAGLFHYFSNFENATSTTIFQNFRKQLFSMRLYAIRYLNRKNNGSAETPRITPALDFYSQTKLIDSLAQIDLIVNETTGRISHALNASQSQNTPIDGHYDFTDLGSLVNDLRHKAIPALNILNTQFRNELLELFSTEELPSILTNQEIPPLIIQKATLKRFIISLLKSFLLEVDRLKNRDTKASFEVLISLSDLVIDLFDGNLIQRIQSAKDSSGILQIIRRISNSIDLTALENEATHDDVFPSSLRKLTSPFNSLEFMIIAFERICKFQQKSTVTRVIMPRIYEDKDIERISSLNEAYDRCYLANDIFFLGWEGLSAGEHAKMELFARLWLAKGVAFKEPISHEDDTEGSPILICLDEADTFMHPEWQRTFLKDLLEFIEKTFEGYHVQLVISTHSPFLLSDVPKENVLFLGEKKPKDPTFGANIHQLLSQDMFMQDTMGAFASSKIERALEHLNGEDWDSEKEEEVRGIIKILGEPLIRKELERLLHYKHTEVRLRNLEQEMKKLKDKQGGQD